MKESAKLKKLVSRPLMIRYQVASPTQRQEMKTLIEEESQWVIHRMTGKGFHLQAIVDEVYGLFTRSAAKETVRMVDEVTT